MTGTRPESRPPNYGLQLTRSARCAHRRTDRGQSLRAAFAADRECSADYREGKGDRYEGF